MSGRDRSARAAAWPLRIGAAATVLLLLLTVERAEAHLALQRSSPAAGALLDSVPDALRLTFSEPVELAAARLFVRAPDGSGVALAAPRHGSAGSRVLVAELAAPLTAAGRYTVEWRLVGRDGHPVSGEFSFHVAEGAHGLADPPPAADSAAGAVPMVPAAPAVGPPAFDSRSPLYVGVRWLGYLALVPLAGVLAFRALVLPRIRPAALPPGFGEAVLSRLRAIGLTLAALLLVALLARFGAQLTAVYGASGAWELPTAAALLRGTTWGTAWLLQAAGVVIVLIALLLGRGKASWSVATVALVAVVIGGALSGHAAAADRAGLLIAADALHVLGAGGWLGSLLMLLVVALPALRTVPGGARPPAVAALVHAFSPLALGCAALLVATGLFAAWTHVGGIGVLATSEYGRTLLLKLGLLLPVLGLGAYNWRRLRPALEQQSDGSRTLARTSGAELAFGALILLVTAVLVATPPPAMAGEAGALTASQEMSMGK